MINIKNKKGFTLIELLVVILIIGILAAVALPEYRIAVERARFATVKDNAHTLARSVQYYYLIHSTNPTNLNDLDVSASGCFLSNYSESLCEVKCSTDKNTYDVVVYFNNNKIKKGCFALSINVNDIANRVCQKETNRTAPYSCSTTYCTYIYP